MSDGTSLVLRSLEVIYDGRASNEDRKQATLYLEEVKDHADAPSLALGLAQDRLRPAVARHYGLSVLEHCIRYKWEGYTPEQTAQVRSWILDLAHELGPDDQAFIRNKTAQLIEEIAEKSWGLDWLDLDEQLCSLWQKSLVHKEVALHTLETLSERVFGKEDSAAGLRGAELGRFCVEIFTSEAGRDGDPLVLDGNRQLRYESYGWIERFTDLLLQYLHEDEGARVTLRPCCVMTLQTLRSCMYWLTLKAVSTTECIEALCECLLLQDPQIQTIVLEVIYALYHRMQFRQEDVQRLVVPFFTSQGVALLRTTYERLRCTPDDADDKYIALKRSTEVICSLGSFLQTTPWLLREDGTSRSDVAIDLRAFVDLLVLTFRNPSLTVSVPIIYLWTKLLDVRRIRHSHEFTRVMGEMLEICNQRLIRYELLPQDADDATIQFLNEDMDTIPEKHAFLGNYRRFCINVIERITRKSPFEAIQYLLIQSSHLLRNLSASDTQDPTTFSTDSIPQLTVEAQCVVVNTAIKSYVKWSRATPCEEMDAGRLEDQAQLHSQIEEWIATMLGNWTRDPINQRRVLALVVDVAVGALDPSSSVGAVICEQVLSSPLVRSMGSTPYEEALKEAQTAQPRELQKLAATFADSLFPAYDEICAAIERHLSVPNVEQRLRLDYQAFLMTVLQRSSAPSREERRQRLQQMVDPIVRDWRDEALPRSTDDLPSFCSLLGLGSYAPYFLSRKAHTIPDWSSVTLDAEGIAMRDAIPLAVEKLPLQATRSLLSVCPLVEGDERGTNSEQLELLQNLTMAVVPVVLKLLGLTHAFNNPATWKEFPAEMRSIVTRTVQDRVWQNGISSESRDDFFARVRASRTSLEGLASATRGAVRAVRDLCMWTLHSLADAGDAFYGHLDLPQPLAHALYDDASWLSPHQLSGLLSLSTTIIDKCPAAQRRHFLPPLLVPLFKLMDDKIGAEWEGLGEREGGDSDSLDREMKTESVLRNLTYSAVMLVSHLLRHVPKPAASSPTDEAAAESRDIGRGVSLRGLILTSPDILESLALFATHTLRMHDSRSCGVVTRVLRGLIPEFQHGDARASPSSPLADATVDAATAASVREFFGTEVLRACIASIHEPYFADMQKELAALVAAILLAYGPRTEAPRRVLLSLPGMTGEGVERHLTRLARAGGERQQRGAVLELLEGVRGVSIHEQGRIAKAPKRSRTAMQERLVRDAGGDMVDDDDDGAGAAGPPAARPNSPELGGVSELFG